MSDHNFRTKHEIDFNLNVNFIHPGVMPILTEIKGLVMATNAKVDDLNAATKSLVDKNAELKDKVVDLKTDVGTLIQAQTDTKAALVNTAAELQALKDQIANGDAIKPEDLDSSITALTQAAADVQTSIDNVTATDTDVEGATGVQTPPVGDGVPTGT